MKAFKKLVPGQIVKSKSGHVKGDVFFVMKVLDDDYVLIADGDRRKSEKPKKKKVKHLQHYNRINEMIAEKLEKNIIVDNIDLQRELAKSCPKEMTTTNY